jgi:hypothetical protein
VRAGEGSLRRGLRAVPALPAFPALMAIAAVLVIRLWMPTPTAPAFGDESVYPIYQGVYAERGVAGLREMVAAYPNRPVMQSYPLPFRLLPIWAGHAVGRLRGGYDRTNLIVVSGIAGLLALGVAARWLAALGQHPLIPATVLWMGLSPTAWAMSQRGLQDALGLLLALCLFYTHHQAWFRRRRTDVLWCGAALFAALLNKEAALFHVFLLGVAALFYRFAWRMSFPRGLLSAEAVAVAAWVGTLAWIAGGFDPLMDAYAAYARAQSVNVYTLNFEKGPWFSYLLACFLNAPLLFLLGVAGFAGTPRGPGPFPAFAGALFVAGCLLLAALPVVNLRVGLFLEFFLYAAAAAWVQSIAAKTARPRAFALAMVCAVALVQVADYRTLFVAGGVANPTHFELLRAWSVFRVP